MARVEELLAVLVGEDEVALAVDGESAVAREAGFAVVVDGEVALADDGDVERGAGGFGLALGGVDDGRVGEEAAAEGFEQGVGGAAMGGEGGAAGGEAAVLRLGEALAEEGEVFLEADGFAVRQVVGDDVLAVGAGEDAAGGEVEAVDHLVIAVCRGRIGLGSVAYRLRLASSRDVPGRIAVYRLGAGRGVVSRRGCSAGVGGCRNSRRRGAVARGIRPP